MLPISLAETYQAYKRHTETIVLWLLSKTKPPGAPDPKPDKASVDGLLQCARQIVANGVDIPRELYWKLEDTINARLEIANFYRQIHRQESSFDEERDSHVHFIQALYQIQHLLFPRGPKRNVKFIASKRASNMLETAEFADTNGYALLEVEEVADQPVQEGISSHEERPTQAQMRQAGLEDQGQQGIILEEDRAALIIRFAYFLLEADFVCSKIKSYWKRVAHNDMSVARAAFLTNVVFSVLDNSMSYPHIKCEYLQRSVEEYLACDIRSEILESISSGIELPQSNVFRESKACYFIHKLLKSLPSIDGPTADPERHEKLLNKAGHFPPDDRGASLLSDDETIVTSLVESMRYIVQNYEEKHDISWDYEVYDLPHGRDRMLQSLYFRCEQSCTCAEPSLLVGLQLHVEIYHSILGADWRLLECSHFRLQALRFAREVHKAALTFLEHQSKYLQHHDCSDCSWKCGTKYLREFCASLQRYASTKRFDHYYQAPWTAGAQIIGINRMAMWFGISACNDTPRFGTILHAYNALRARGYVGEVPLFEELCELLTGAVFRGRRTSQNFTTAHMCFLGARLNFRKPDRSQNTPPAMRGFSKLSFDAYTGPHQILPNDESIFCTLARPGFYFPRDQILVRCLKVTRPQWSALSSDAIQRKAQAESTASFRSIRVVDYVDEATESEFEGRFPITKINWFAVCVTAEEILEHAGDGKWTSHFPNQAIRFLSCGRILQNYPRYPLHPWV